MSTPLPPASGGETYGGLWFNFSYNAGELLMDNFSFISTQAAPAPKPEPEPETPDDQITNAGFEAADGWTLDGACAIDTAEYHGGSASLKVSGAGEPVFTRPRLSKAVSCTVWASGPSRTQPGRFMPRSAIKMPAELP